MRREAHQFAQKGVQGDKPIGPGGVFERNALGVVELLYSGAFPAIEKDGHIDRTIDQLLSRLSWRKRKQNV